MHIYVDSQSAITSLAKVDVDSELLARTISLLNGAAKKCDKLTIRWVKAHAISAGNNEADRLANEGRQLPQIAYDAPKTPWAIVKSEIATKVDAYWNWAWEREETCRQTKQWFPKLDPKRSFKIMQLMKPQWGKICQFITGHNSLNRHLYLTESAETESPVCNLCNEAEMTSAHIIGECPALHWARADALGSHFVDPPTTSQWEKSIM